MPGFVPLEDTLLAQATITGPDIKGILSRHHHIRWRSDSSSLLHHTLNKE